MSSKMQSRKKQALERAQLEAGILTVSVNAINLIIDTLPTRKDRMKLLGKIVGEIAQHQHERNAREDANA